MKLSHGSEAGHSRTKYPEPNFLRLSLQIVDQLLPKTFHSSALQE